MSGMGSGIALNNPVIVAAFHSALLRQSLVVLAILVILALAWYWTRQAHLRRSDEGPGPADAGLPAEPPARKALRVGFGLLWLLDGFLQLQPAMPVGLTSQVIQPASASSPAWVQHLVNFGTTIWNNHPIEASTSAVWIQLGIGAWLLVAPRGRWSRGAGIVSAGWGLFVWVFGEAFGGIFAPGATWLFGAPGAVLLYSVAGGLIALPERYWASRRFTRTLLSAAGLYLVGMAVLEAWPGRGFWRGHAGAHSAAGPVVAMTRQMSGTAQPAFFARAISDFSSFDAAHGFAVNLFVTVILAVAGLALLSGYRRVMAPALAAYAVLSLATWILVQDLGFFGGVGTDPNSMIPTLLVVGGAWLAYIRAPSEVPAESPSAVAGWRERATPTYVFRALAAFGALGVILLGAAPMAMASTNPVADTIVAESIGGTPTALNLAAPRFSLTDQFSRPKSLAGFRGKVVVLTFLDPVCTSDCPLIAQEMREADQMLGASARHVEFVAVVTNPIFHSVSAVDAFDRQESLEKLANWWFLTGSVSQLGRVWSSYGIEAIVESAGAMVDHSEILYVIDGSGRTRFAVDSDPGPGTSSTRSSFAAELAGEVRQLLPAG